MRCPVFTEGQQIEYTHGGGGVPAGFCDWAWGDIFKDVLAMCGKAEYMQGRCSEIPPAYTCCTDGLRPVIFKIEAID